MSDRVAGRPLLTVYSRAGCHLCECLIEALLPLVRDRADVEVRDIDSRADWRATYDALVPVVEHDGREICRYRLDPDAIRAVLGGQRAETGG